MSTVLESNNRVLTTETSLPTQQISNMFAGLKVLGLVADNSACGFYRIMNPLQMLKLHGADVEFGSHHTMEAFMRYDIIVAPRQHSPEVYEILRTMRWEGKTIIYEIDDDLDSVLPSSPAYFSYHPGCPELKMIPKFMRWADGMTVTTPEIAKWYYQHNKNIAIIENYIDLSFREWDADVQWRGASPIITPLPIKRPEAFEGRLVIGWQGGTTHQEDLLQIGTAIQHVIAKYPHVDFAMYSSVQNQQEFINTFNLPAERVHCIEPRHFLDHPEGLKGIDIGLAPIKCCQFNLCKSNLKVLEGMAVGTAMVASNVGPYARFERKHPGSILTVGQGKHSHSSWGSALTELIENPAKLLELQEEGRKLIYEQYSLEKNFARWPSAWRQIQQKVQQGDTGWPKLDKPKDYFKSFKVTGRNDSCPCGSGEKYKNCCVSAWG